MTQPYEIMAYYFPNYHQDRRNAAWHGTGWTEWELVQRATPRFPGHQQPNVPAWGYEDEALPGVAEHKIAFAADHGLRGFIFDWYWYADGPFLQRALEEGFLGASNNARLRFSLMWANHDWVNIHPFKRSMTSTVLARGAVFPMGFQEATNYVIARYFTHPSYWRVDGRPYFSIYDLVSLLDGLGGLDEARRALDGFRARTRAAGFPDVHLNAVVWNLGILPGEKAPRDHNDLLERLGFDSVTSYIWIHHTPLETFPTVPYRPYAERAMEDWTRFTALYRLPYYPNVTMGWDPSPRTVQSDVYDNLGYPFTPILEGNTPQEFERVLREARRFLDQGRTSPPILTVNAWNEWTEGSYLEPDTRHGTAYLEAIKRVFRG
jgi:hypothetical protein